MTTLCIPPEGIPTEWPTPVRAPSGGEPQTGELAGASTLEAPVFFADSSYPQNALRNAVSPHPHVQEIADRQGFVASQGRSGSVGGNA